MVEACIICHESKAGALVDDTLMLRSLRRLKADFPPVQLLWGKPTGNTLVVCPSCMEKFDKKRKAYEGKVLLHVLLSVGLMVFIIVLPLIGGTFTLGSLVVGLLLAIMLMALPLLDYVPPLRREEIEQKNAQAPWQMPIFGLSAQAPQGLQTTEQKETKEEAPAPSYEPPKEQTTGAKMPKRTAPPKSRSKTAKGRRR